MGISWIIMKKYILVLFIILMLLPGCSKNNGENGTDGASLVLASLYEGEDAREIEFTTTGRVFAPVIVLKDGASATVRWTFNDATTSESLTPDKDYGSPATRVTRLKVTPWSSLRRINVGYDRGDGGSDEIEMVPNNYVTAIANFDLVKRHLVELCISLNPITSLDISNFVKLETLECYWCTTLDSVNLHNTPNLKRICFEDCNIGATLDLSSNTRLEDLRASGNVIHNLIPPINAPNWWHFCAGGGNHYDTNPNFNKFPHLREIWVWNCNLTGNMVINLQENLNWVWLSGNPITGLDLSSAQFSGNGHIQAYDCSMAGANAFNIVGCTGITDIEVHHNALTYIDLTGQSGIDYLDAHGNDLTEAAIEDILFVLDGSGVEDGTVDLSENSPPNAQSSIHKTSLEAKRWVVSLD